MVATDSHAHLGHVADEFGELALRGLLEAYAEAWAGATGGAGRGPLLVDIGTEPGDLAGRAARIAAAAPAGGAPFLRLSAGVWPGEAALADPGRALGELEASVEAFARSGGSVAAIGECGLDYHHMEGPRASQISLFEGQAELARRLGLPLVVHSREAFGDTLGLLERLALPVPVIVHCFGYGTEEARAFLALGCLVSFAGNLTYRKSGALREACALVPAERLLLETDAPYMNPEPGRGKPSTSLDVERTYRAAAELRGERAEDLAGTVSANAFRLFG